MSFSVLIFAAASIYTAACSGRSSTEPSSGAAVTYQGVFVTGKENGTLTLVMGSPASGTLKVTGGSTVGLSGTYTPATSTFALAGAGYTVKAAVNGAAEVTGTVTSTGAPTGGTMAALISTTARQTYCGQYFQTNPPVGVPADSGVWLFVINTTVVAGVASSQISNSNSYPSFTLAGTSVRGVINLSWATPKGRGSASGIFHPNPEGVWDNGVDVHGIWYTDSCSP